ncbi:DUF84 family protein [Sporolactobacillus inulinus]|jgi:inosine/xanthosine triphosphatase|uniref:inosine/xanthosine triphosphatase n=2 Tax=Sporolactobacillus inulinus TaxID=2078 RepID=A0A4Y1ZEL4_9BACL|nr:DUF84 family protein [Sporolactobacillus inulinus]KLI02848.1 NTPase [Sporolactobacillus inulinus CASD]GAY77535.1 inosine/xanthosine triphosphatase [Sporolactobacillus inulinus]GEB75745.1 NTPase [Sporolactobacillus inulinus]
MIIIGVGTKNPAKLNAVKQIVEEQAIDAEIRSYDVPSGVSAMPMSDHETRQGAVNRAKAVLNQDPEVTFGIGMEGGVSDLDGEMFLVNWGACADREGRLVRAGGARILLPQVLADGVRSGHELGDVADAYFHQESVHTHGGTIGILTEGRVSRTEMFRHILKLIEGIYAYQKR